MMYMYWTGYINLRDRRKIMFEQEVLFIIDLSGSYCNFFDPPFQSNPPRVLQIFDFAGFCLVGKGTFDIEFSRVPTRYIRYVPLNRIRSEFSCVPLRYIPYVPTIFEFAHVRRVENNCNAGPICPDPIAMYDGVRANWTRITIIFDPPTSRAQSNWAVADWRSGAGRNRRVQKITIGTR